MLSITDKIKLEILNYSYWEHFKANKDLSLTLDINHKKRKAIGAELNNMSQEINKLKIKEVTE